MKILKAIALILTVIAAVIGIAASFLIVLFVVFGFIALCIPTFPLWAQIWGAILGLLFLAGRF